MVGLAKTFSLHGHLVWVVTSGHCSRLSAELEKSEVKLVTLPSRRFRGLIAPFRLGWSIMRARPDWVYAFLLDSCILVSVMKWMFPRARIAWGIRDSFDQSSQFSLTGRMGIGLARRLSRRADLLITNSVSGWEAYKRNGFDLSRSAVVSNGIDTKFFRPDPPSGLSFRLDHGLSLELPVIGMIAREHAMKGHRDFVEMAGILTSAGITAQYAIVGRSTDTSRSALLDLASSLGLSSSLLFIGEVDNPNSALNALTVCVIPSRYGEGFSNVLAEALAVGIPVVATRVGDNAAIMGDHGRVVEPRDPRGLANAVRQILLSSPLEVGSSREAIVERYSLSEAYSRTLKVLNTIAT